MKILFLLLVSFNSFSYTYLSAARDVFPNPHVSINFSSNTCPNAGLNSTADIVSAVMEAVNKFWNKVPTSALYLKQGSTLAFDSDGKTLTDLLNATSANTILVGCNDDEFSSANTLGIATFQCASATNCRGALLLNNNATSNPIANGSRAQLLSTIAHEIGHAFGLGHTSDVIALMYYAEDGRTQNYLTSDDIDGVSNLYPHDKELGGLLGSCGSLSYVSNDKDDNDSNYGFLLSLFLGIFLILFFKMWGRLFSRPPTY